MAIEGVEQPKLLEINKYLWLRKYDGYLDFALIWHQDLELVWLIDGDEEVYSVGLIVCMAIYQKVESAILLKFLKMGSVNQ
ncbi:MAG TPA: hypothetical protein PLD31_06245 [Streptococcus parasuis]|nr:hypothetical protein [Streptococcus parasuis]